MIKIGNIELQPGIIPVQTMIKNPTTDVALTLQKIRRLKDIGCDIIRITVPDEPSAAAIGEIVKESPIPIVADIHFDYRLAIKAIEAGVAKVRINPGNIGDESRVAAVISCLKEYGIPVRIGINGGSLPKHITDKIPDKCEAMIAAAEEELGYFDKYGYDKIVLSFKSSNVLETLKVNRMATIKFGLPLHIGVTEAGDKFDGTIKNAIGISHLLLDGIGSTIRVSLTAPEEDEVRTGIKILESVGLRKSPLEVISCPTCGRTGTNLFEIVEQFKIRSAGVKLARPVKAAIMGCVVNGPGEAKDADFGVACGKDKSVIFSENGSKTVKNESILDELLMLLNRYSE